MESCGSVNESTIHGVMCNPQNPGSENCCSAEATFKTSKATCFPCKLRNWV